MKSIEKGGGANVQQVRFPLCQAPSVRIPSFCRGSVARFGWPPSVVRTPPSAMALSLVPGGLRTPTSATAPSLIPGSCHSSTSTPKSPACCMSTVLRNSRMPSLGHGSVACHGRLALRRSVASVRFCSSAPLLASPNPALKSSVLFPVLLAAAKCSAGKATQGAAAEPFFSHVLHGAPPSAIASIARPGRPSLLHICSPHQVSVARPGRPPLPTCYVSTVRASKEFPALALAPPVHRLDSRGLVTAPDGRPVA